MAVRDVAAASGAIIQIAATIQELGNNWYKASADWDDFPRKIDTFKRKLEFWTKEFVKSGMVSDSSLMETLREAADLLEKEKATLQRRGVRSGARCCFMMNRTMFPAKVGLRIQHVIDAFDAIPSVVQQEQEAAVALQQRMMRRARSLSFRDDDRYVPLKLTESKVYAALEEPNGCPLVLLCGGPGKGKSTLARRVALQYDRKSKNAEENPERHFELVAFLECGPKADITASQLKLANLISPYSGATADPEAQGISSGAKDAISRRLKGVLKHQKILIALDDVCEPEFLQKMLDVCGVGVKCLVTAQDRDLCGDLSLSRPAIQIQIEDIENDVAMQILASHVGFPDKQIPAHIEGLARRVIEGMEKHPLALASVAKEIDPDRSYELDEWEAASESFLTALQSRVTKRTFGVPYPESFWVTTQRSIDAVRAVSPDAPSLLILLHMCEAPSVPEEVLRILFFSAVCEAGSDQFKLSKFKTAMKALRSRGLVNISSQAQESYSWSAHSLQKLFMEHEMGDQKETILKTLGRKSDELTSESAIDLSVQEDRRVCISLCALYFHKHYFKKTGSVLDIPPIHLNRVTRGAIEPITRLLALPVSERWSQSAQLSAKQIYLRYIYGCALHESGIMDLMALQVSVWPMLQALRNIAAVGSETPLIGENSGPLLKALLDLLGNFSHTGDFMMATLVVYVFYELSSLLHQGVIMSSGILDTIVKILSGDNNPLLLDACSYLLCRLCYNETAQHERIVVQTVQSMNADKIPGGLQEAAVVESKNLAASTNYISKEPLMNFPGLLEELVNLLTKDDSPNLQTQAAVSLRNLTVHSQDAKEKIVHCPGAIQHLLVSMSNDRSAQVQLEAAKTLVNLTGVDNDIAMRRLVDFPGLVQQWVNLLSKDDSPDLQTQAAVSLANLTHDAEHAREKIVSCPGAIRQLLVSMSNDGNAQVQLEAAIALFNLTTSKNDSSRQRLANFPGLLEQLVNLLSDRHNPHIHTQAAMSLANFTVNSEDVIEKIMSCPGAIQQLLVSMSYNRSAKVQLEAAKALFNLTTSENDIIMRQLVDFPGLLERLVNLLSKDDNPHLQTQAVMSLANLTFNSEDAMGKIVWCPGAIQQLLVCMSNSSSAQVQLKAAEAFVNLSASENNITKQGLVDFPGLLEQWVNLLSKDHNLDLQIQATMFLGNLTSSSEYAREKIVCCTGIIQQLLVSMFNEGKAQVQLKAAKVLVNLSGSKNDITKQGLVDFPGLLEQLVKLLSKDHNPDLQIQGAMFLQNLATSDYGRERIVCCTGAIQQLLVSMSKEGSAQVHLKAAEALVNLTASTNDITSRQLVNFPRLVEELVKLLSREGTDDLQSRGAYSLCNLAETQVEEMRFTIMQCSGLLEKFITPLSSKEFHQKSGWAYYVAALTYIDPVQGNRAYLHSAIAFSRRGYANMLLGQNKESLEDLNQANKMVPGDHFTLRSRCIVRTRLEDFEGALEDSDSITEKQCTAFDLQERGVLRKLMKDFQGALADLNRSLELHPNDYECLKHRAVVRFLLEDETGAHSDAQMALKLKPERVDASSYGRCCLGVTSVEFLDYKLK